MNRRQFLFRTRKQRDLIQQIIIFVIVAAFILAPLYWVFATSFKSMGTEYNYPPEVWPSSPTLDAYRIVLADSSRTVEVTTGEVSQDETSTGIAFLEGENVSVATGLGFGRPVLNSLIIASSVAVINLLLASLAAYAIARLRFRFKVSSLIFLQTAGMIPPVVTIAPIFVFLRTAGLLQSRFGLILPYVVFTLPLSIWLLATYFAELPFELEDAGKIDGYNPLQVYWRVILPLSAPGLFSAGVFAFLAAWGEFMLASTITLGRKELQTVPIALLQFSHEFRWQWTWVSAGIVMATTIVVLLALVFQRWVVQGLTASSVKR